MGRTTNETLEIWTKDFNRLVWGDIQDEQEQKRLIEIDMMCFDEKCEETRLMVLNSNFLFEYGIDMNFNIPDTLQYTLNNFGAIGGYIDMTITGDFTDNNGVVRTLSASVHVIRDH